jgi:hypothetical protein
VVSVNGLWIGEKGDGWKGTVRSDVKGYYGYLQSLFIRNDHGHEPYVWEYVRYTDDGRTVNKYFCGTSVMMAPWFGIGHAIALSDPEAPKDGLSIHEMRALSIGAWVYLLLGLLALRALLLGIGVREGAVAWTLAAIALGTQLMQYAALQPGWSHIHTFCAVSVFLLVIHRLHRDASVWLWVAAAALLGLVVLIRPVNGLVVLAIPVVAGQDTWALLRGLLQRPWVLIGAVVMGMAVVGIQPLLWYMQTGRWFAYGYQGEGFHWDRPEVFKVLFGFRRGLFLWAPVLLLALFGTLRMLRKERPRGLGMLVYWAANTYVISSWWIWYYGSGFGSRVFVDHYPVLAIPMALLLNDLRGRWWTLTRTYIVACSTTCTSCTTRAWTVANTPSPSCGPARSTGICWVATINPHHTIRTAWRWYWRKAAIWNANARGGKAAASKSATRPSAGGRSVCSTTARSTASPSLRSREASQRDEPSSWRWACNATKRTPVIPARCWVSPR